MQTFERAMSIIANSHEAYNNIQGSDSQTSDSGVGPGDINKRKPMNQLLGAADRGNASRATVNAPLSK